MLAQANNKIIILINGKKDCRQKVSNYLINEFVETEALQFGFFLKTYAARITNKEEQFINDNKYDLITFETEGMFQRILDCVNDTTSRLGQPAIEYNKMALLAIFNFLFSKNLRLEHEIEKEMTINLYTLIKQIGQIWKLVFTETIWSDLVITAINRSNANIILVDDFRFPEEYVGLQGFQNLFTMTIIDEVNKSEHEEGYDSSNYELEHFNFDYLINCTIPTAYIATNYIMPQLQAILEDINFQVHSLTISDN